MSESHHNHKWRLQAVTRRMGTQGLLDGVGGRSIYWGMMAPLFSKRGLPFQTSSALPLTGLLDRASDLDMVSDQAELSQVSPQLWGELDEKALHTLTMATASRSAGGVDRDGELCYAGELGLCGQGRRTWYKGWGLCGP